MYAGRVRYPRDDMVDVHLVLQNANGEPLRGRADLEVMVVDPSGAPDHAAFKTGVIEDNYQPGVYHANVRVPAAWDKVAALTSVSETGNPNAPGHLALVQTHVDHSAPAALREGPLGYYDQEGLELVVEVEASRKGNGVVRGELIDGSHASFGELVWQGPLEVGINRLTVPAHAIQDDGTHGSQIFYVSDLTIYVDGDWSDFDANPRIVKLQPQPPPAVGGR